MSPDSTPEPRTTPGPTTTDPVPALAVEGLEVRYSGVPAVRGISFTLGRGETLGMIGPNGAGKSSTLLAIMGAERVSAGSVRLGGLELVGLNPETVITKGLALVPEGRHIFGNLTVHQNLRLGEVGRRSREGLAEDLEWVLALFPVLREFRDRTAGLLSGGQQQQLAIARSLLAKPDVLMLDEPSLGLSPTSVDTVFEALTQVRDAGTSILIVEQRAEATIAFCDRTHVLHDGELTLELRPEDAADEELLTKAYFGS